MKKNTLLSTLFLLSVTTTHAGIFDWLNSLSLSPKTLCVSICMLSTVLTTGFYQENRDLRKEKIKERNQFEQLQEKGEKENERLKKSLGSTQRKVEELQNALTSRERDFQEGLQKLERKLDRCYVRQYNRFLEHINSENELETDKQKVHQDQERLKKKNNELYRREQSLQLQEKWVVTRNKCEQRELCPHAYISEQQERAVTFADALLNVYHDRETRINALHEEVACLHEENRRLKQKEYDYSEGTLRNLVMRSGEFSPENQRLMRVLHQDLFKAQLNNQHKAAFIEHRGLTSSFNQWRQQEVMMALRNKSVERNGVYFAFGGGL